MEAKCDVDNFKPPEEALSHKLFADFERIINIGDH